MQLEQLESRVTPAYLPFYHSDLNAGRFSEPFAPFGDMSVLTAEGDVTGDGLKDLALTPKDNIAHVQVFDHAHNPISSFFAFDPAFAGGAGLAVADVTGDGAGEIIAAAGPGGGPQVSVFTKDGTWVTSFMAYAPEFRGGIRVTAADLTGDGVAEIVVTPASDGGPHVQVFDIHGTVLASFMAYSPFYTGGVSLAVGDFTATGVPTIITGSLSGAGHVRAFTMTGTVVGEAMTPTVGIEVDSIDDDVFTYPTDVTAPLEVTVFHGGVVVRSGYADALPKMGTTLQGRYDFRYAPADSSYLAETEAAIRQMPPKMLKALGDTTIVPVLGIITNLPEYQNLRGMWYNGLPYEASAGFLDYSLNRIVLRTDGLPRLSLIHETGHAYDHNGATYGSHTQEWFDIHNAYTWLYPYFEGNPVESFAESLAFYVRGATSLLPAPVIAYLQKSLAN